MRKGFLVLVVILFSTGLFGTDYELTEVDLFSVKENFSSDNVTVLGIGINTPVSHVYKRFNLTARDVVKKDEYRFLNIKPGLKLRLKNKIEIAAIIIDMNFKSSLKGETAAFFDTADSAEHFFNHVKRFFPGPDDSETNSFLKFVNDKLSYDAGFEFSRFGEKKKPTLIWQIYAGKPGAVFKKELMTEGSGQPAPKTYDLRKVRWGMSMADVKRVENLKVLKETGDYVIFQDKIIGFPVLLAFHFNNDKLYRCNYVFTQKHTNKNDYIYDYKKIKEALTKKYGKPKNDFTTWKNKLYQDDIEKWGFAVSLGHLTYLATWENIRSTFFLQLEGDNYKLELVLVYESKALEKKETDESDKF